MKRSIGAIVVTLLVAFGSSFATAEDSKIKIGFQPGTSPRFFVARDQQLFQKAGLAPEYVKFIAGPPMLAALQNGTIDMAFMTTAPAIFGLAQGIDYRVFLVEADAYRSIALVSTPGAGMKGIQDQKGKRLGVQFGTSAHYALLRSLELAKIPESAVKVVDMQASVILPAFIRGDIDGGWAWDPWVAKMEAEGGRMVWALSDVRLPMPLVWVARRAWLDANPGATQRFFKAMAMAHEYLAAHRDQGVASLGEVLGVDERLARKIFDRIEVPTLEQQLTGYVGALGTSATKASAGMARHMKELAEFFFKLKKIPSVPDVAGAIAPEPLEAYLSKK